MKLPKISLSNKLILLFMILTISYSLAMYFTIHYLTSGK